MAKTRLLLDTCAVIDLITSLRETDVEFWDIYDDPDISPRCAALPDRRRAEGRGRRTSSPPFSTLLSEKRAIIGK